MEMKRIILEVISLKTMWKGSISFGLVNIPIKLYTSSEATGIKFRQLHSKCHNPISYKKYCPSCNEDVTGDDIIRGYEYEKGRYVVIEDSDLDRIPDETTRTIDIIDFVNIEEIDPIFYDRTYYVAPEESAVKPYTLLRESMEKTGKIAIAKIVIRSKESLATIRTFKDGYLVMETMYYPAEIRNITELPALSEVKLSEKELKMAEQLVESLAEPFNPEKYTDDYRKALMDIIRSKVEGKDIVEPHVKDQGKVLDLMEALKASIEATQKEKDKAPTKKTAKRKTG